MIPQRLIEAKRDGRELAASELDELLGAFMAGDLPDYQMAAFLMAVYFQGMSPTELDTLLRAMIDSGQRLDLGRFGPARVDKHSTGGVGDKVSLVLAPLVAELGVVVPMMSGRSLGHSGGTLDKLDAIPGFRTQLSLLEFERILEDLGCAMIGQTDEIAPLDRRLYALRDVTATVPSIPLIAASIMSKKLSEDLTGLVLDVKVGRGAFLKEDAQASRLARTMVDLGSEHGVPTVARMTSMDQPLGSTVGNALETQEAIEALRGGGPQDLRTVVLCLAGEMLALGGVYPDADAGERAAQKTLDSGRALDRFRRLVERQGGDVSVVDDPRLLDIAPERSRVEAVRSGVVQGIDPVALGWGAVELGGGRRSMSDRVHPGVGFRLSVNVGDEVRAGQPLGTVYARSVEDVQKGSGIMRSAVEIGPEPRQPGPVLRGRIVRKAV